MALRLGRSLTRFYAPLASRFLETPLPSFLQTTLPASPSSFPERKNSTATSALPAGHMNSDLTDSMCNIRLSRLRDITLRRDVILHAEDGQSTSLANVFKGHRALLVGVPGGKVCCQQHLPAYLDKANELTQNKLDKIICVFSAKDDDLASLMKSSDKSKVCFYEDRDLAFARMLGLERMDGPKTQRFAAVVNDGLLLRMNVEKHPREVKETTYDVLLDVWKQFCAKS